MIYTTKIYIKMEDKWKQIENYPNYQVSSDGQIKNQNGMIMRLTDKDGYSRIMLSNNGVRKQYLVHRLVAFAFIINHNSKPEINHLDLDKKNNSIDNLEWCTRKENIDHAIANNARIY